MFARTKLVDKFFKVADTIMLLIDHQQGTLTFCRNIPYKMIIQNTRTLARFAKELNIPVILTSSMEDRAQGPLINDLKCLLPKEYDARIKRAGIANAWEDPVFRGAVEGLACGKKNVIMAGLTNDVCIAYPAASMVEDGYNVLVVQDAGGSPSRMADENARRLWEKAGARTITANALALELGRDWASPDGSKVIKVVMEEIVSKLDEMVAPNPVKK
ncbi:probable hydrolase YcaC [Paramacrobiotus metropolitanus]|uniref:probable hydrolase YcaC n=1 Tax=Paramacrobiotus metropolitanus TaxID=2943436 RepID=UPI0024460B73|nr:probable hydrolase YcaC [Paramacrobiotus metropolitanus]